MILPIVIPAKNEEKRLLKTIQSIKEMCEFSKVEPYIVVVDDGSKDKTAEIAEGAGCHVCRLKDRGYSALGKPELADTHNAGFNYITENLKDNYTYLMVIGSDTAFQKDYLSILLSEMEKNPNLAMCSGILDGYYTNPRAVRGSGRIIRLSFWKLVGCKLPNNYYSWESYPVVYANAKGFDTKTIYNAGMSTDRPPMHGVDWKRYGIGMRENGSLFIYVLLRAARACIKITPKQGYRLILGYLSGAEQMYPPEMRSYTRRYQLNRIKQFLTFSR